MWFFQNPEVIFYHFFCIFNLDIFWVLILQKRIGNRYLVPVTPTTVLSRSFWNFTGALRMVWRYACGFFRILKLFFITLHILNLDIFWVLILQKCIGSNFYHFFRILTLDIFWVLILQKRIGSRWLVPVTPTTVLSRSFWTFHSVWPIFLKLYMGF